MLLSFIILSNIQFIFADDMIAISSARAAPVSGALSSYITAVAGNLNDFIIVGFLIVCVTSAISLFFTQDNVLKVLSKVAFGLFLLKAVVAIMIAMVGK